MMIFGGVWLGGSDGVVAVGKVGAGGAAGAAGAMAGSQI